MEPNSPQWNKKVHGELASISFKKDISVEYVLNLSKDLILGNYSSLAWNLLMKFFSFQDRFLEFFKENFIHFDSYFSQRNNFELLDYFKVKASIYDFLAFKNSNMDHILHDFGLLLDSMNHILDKKLDQIATTEWSNLKQEIFAKFIFHKSWNHLQTVVSTNVLIPKLKDVDQDIIDLLVSISTHVPVEDMEPTTLVRYSCVSNWMVGNVLCFKASLRSDKVKRKDLTRLSIDWMLPPIMSLLKNTVDKESRHIFDFLSNGNMLLIDELTFIKYPWDLSRIVHFTACNCDSGDIRRWLRKLFTLLMEQSNSNSLNISDIEAFLIGCVFEMTNFYSMKKVGSVQEMLYINSIHPWIPSNVQIMFWHTLLTKYSYHKILLSEQVDDAMMSGFTSDIRGGSKACLMIYGYISFRYSRRMKYRNEPLYDECKTFRDYYLSQQTYSPRSVSLWNENATEVFFSPISSYLKTDLDAKNSPSSIKSRIEKCITEALSSPLKPNTALIETLCNDDEESDIEKVDLCLEKRVLPEERLKRQLNLLNQIDQSADDEIVKVQTVPETETKINTRLNRLMDQLNSVS